MPYARTWLSAYRPMKTETYLGRAANATNASFADVEDWDLVCSVRVNVWLRGPQHATRVALTEISPSLVEPVVTVLAGAPLDFLPRSWSIGTLILEDASALRLDDQQRILAWLDDVAEGTR